MGDGQRGGREAGVGDARLALGARKGTSKDQVSISRGQVSINAIEFVILDVYRGGEVVTYARVVIGHQEGAIIEEATGVGTSPWPLSVLFGDPADPSRLSCLLALRERPRTVGEIPAATDLGRPNVSKHLSCLRESSLVHAERSGRFVAHGVADLEVEELLGVGEPLLARIEGCSEQERNLW